jgi:hypothetical protein
MKLYDKLIIAFVAAIAIIVYIVESVTFEMTTDSRIFTNGLPAFLISVVAAIYFNFKYNSAKKVETYFATFVYSLLLWVIILSTHSKLKFLYYAATRGTTEASIGINNVEKVFRRRRFTETKLTTNYDGKEIVLETSRTNFFALQHKEAVKVLIGKADSNNYYVTKIFWQPGEVSEARLQYWLFWLKRNWLIPVIILGFALAVTIIIKRESPPKVHSRDTFVPPKPWPIWKWLAVIAVPVLLLIPALIISRP